MALDIAEGMCALHRSGLSHGDLNSFKVLVSGEGRGKISSFSLKSCYHVLHATPDCSFVGRSVAWTAPEVLRDEELAPSMKSDVFSFGVILWELVTGSIPWEGMNPFGIIKAVGYQRQCLEVPQVPHRFSMGLRDLMTSCFSGIATRKDFEVIVDILKTLLDVPPYFVCPITLTIMEDPVMCSDGHTYERAAIESWLQTSIKSPKTNLALQSQSITINYALRDAITSYKRNFS